MEPGRVLDRDRREPSGRGAGKSGAFSPAFSVGRSVALAVERCPPKQANRQEANASKSTGGGLQENRPPTGAAGQHGGQPMASRAAPMEAAKTDRQQGGQPRRKGFYAPGIVSWELDIYAPYSPPNRAQPDSLHQHRNRTGAEPPASRPARQPTTGHSQQGESQQRTGQRPADHSGRRTASSTQPTAQPTAASQTASRRGDIKTPAPDSNQTRPCANQNAPAPA